MSYVVEVWSRIRDDEKCHSENHYKGRCVWCKEGRCEEVKESDFSFGRRPKRNLFYFVCLKLENGLVIHAL